MMKKTIAIFLILISTTFTMVVDVNATVATKELKRTINEVTTTIESNNLTLKEQIAEIITASLNSKKTETINWLNSSLGRVDTNALDNNVSHVFEPETIAVFANNLIVQIKKAEITDRDEIIEVVESLYDKLFTLTINTTASKAPYLIRYSGDLALKEKFPEIDFEDVITSEYSLNEREIGVYSTLKSTSLIDLNDISLVSPLEEDIRVNLTSSFGRRSVVNKVYDKNHRGIDVARPKGTKIFAAEAGTVIVATYGEGFGNHVIIEHNGFYTLYAHASELLVKMNAKVEKGDVIAKVGSTGNSTGSHLHFEVVVDGESINPLYYLQTQ